MSPTLNTGHILTADDFTYLLPVAARKTADTSRSTTTTLTNDPELTLALVANYVYTFQAVLIIDGGNVGDMKIGFTFPTGTTMTWGLIDNPVTITSPLPASSAVFTGAFGSATSGSSFFNAGLAGTGNQIFTPVGGLVSMGSTSGSLNLQWAQASSDGTAAIMKAGSWLKCSRIA